ncbi:MAG: FAD-binding oxidoreductase [Synechococcales cyanobacterium SupBloom_Metag_052]|nr:FAD-binding oxidoreductase [Synechococcales cyanobacterium SupBloom_Metag_052]
MITPEPDALEPLVRELHRQATPWLPAGQGTRLPWGAPVAADTPVVSCRRLDRLLEHAVGDFTVTVQAGMPLRDLQAALAEQGQWLALDWPWGSGADGQDSGSIGGLVARGMAAGLRQRYLGVRDQVIGLALLRADGTAARAGGKVVKNVAGYDLVRLFAGSWGSLGLITELSLRTYPLPRQRRGLWLQGGLAELERLRQKLLAAALAPELVDWWSAPLALAAGQAPQPGLLVSLASVSAAAIGAQLTEITSEAEAAGLQPQQLDSERLEAIRAVALGPGLDPANSQGQRWLLRLGVLPSQGMALLGDPALAGVPGWLEGGSGLGLAWAPAQQLPAYRVEQLRRRCQELGGALTLLEQPTGADLPAWEDAPSRPLIEAIKRQFDPSQQLARGRLPGVRPGPIRSGS